MNSIEFSVGPSKSRSGKKYYVIPFTYKLNSLRELVKALKLVILEKWKKYVQDVIKEEKMWQLDNGKYQVVRFTKICSR